MTAQKQLMSYGFSRREARQLRRLGQMRWKELFRDPEFIKGRARQRIEDNARRFDEKAIR